MDELKKDLFEKIFSQVITVYNLPVNLYKAIGKELEKAIYQGFGGSLKDFDIGKPDWKVLKELKKNVYEFSAAKTFQQTKDMGNVLLNSSGFKRNFSEFKEYADKIFNTYNTDWLATEYNTAISQAQSAVNWNEIQEQKDVLPLLMYQTVGDGLVRPEHAELDGIVRPVDDSFWNDYYPPIDWGCRCIVVQLEEGEVAKFRNAKRGIKTDLSKIKLPKIPTLFRNNAGKDRIIFDTKRHPYFKVEKKYEQLKRNNFGLKLPEND